MGKSPDFLAAVIAFAENELLDFLLLSCENEEIPLFILEAIRTQVYRNS